MNTPLFLVLYRYKATIKSGQKSSIFQLFPVFSPFPVNILYQTSTKNDVAAIYKKRYTLKQASKEKLLQPFNIDRNIFTSFVHIPLFSREIENFYRLKKEC